MSTRQVREELELQELLRQMFPSPAPVMLDRSSWASRSTSIDLGDAELILMSTDLTDFGTDAFVLARSLGKRPLSCIACHLLAPYAEELHLDLRKMRAFFRAVEDGYHDIAYHSAVHAADVLIRTHAIVSCLDMGALTRLGLYLAAAAHDYGHYGVTNSYLIASRHILARRYHDQSPLENFHTAATLDLLSRPDTAFLPEQYMHTLSGIVRDLILSTDIEKHGDVLRHCQDSGKRFLRLCLKTADIGHTATLPHIHQRWTQALRAELKAQQVKEVSAGLPQTLPAFEASHGKFFDYIVLPMLRELHHLAPHTAPLLENAHANRRLYT